MHGPASPAWLMVALCAATGGWCLLRLRSTVEELRRSAGAEALMGFGMAAMAVPATVMTRPAWFWALYAAVFAAAALHTLRSLWAARADRHHLHHLIGDLAMVYMAVLMAASPGHHGHGGGGVPALTGALLVYFTGYALIYGARLLSVPAGGTPARVPGAGVTAPAGSAGPGRPGGMAWGDRPEIIRACRVSMGIAMVAMLVGL